MEFLTPENIASVGFPMAVAGYLLTRFEKVITSLTATVAILTTTVQENTTLTKALAEKVDKNA